MSAESDLRALLADPDTSRYLRCEEWVYGNGAAVLALLDAAQAIAGDPEEPLGWVLLDEDRAELTAAVRRLTQETT